MRYTVKRQSVLDFDKAEVAKIDKYVWGGEYRPEAYAKLVLVEGEGFALQMTCMESEPLAVYKNFDDPVWKDSCLEFFASFNNASPLYMNLEMNSAGAFLMGIRTSRENKRSAAEIVALPHVKATKGEGFWRVEYMISFEIIEKLFGKTELKSGSVFKGNFYKCGDDTAVPHFGSWAPIGTEKPDFHRPEYFGELVIE